MQTSTRTTAESLSSMDGSGLIWRPLIAMCFIAALNFADRTAISSVFPLLRADLGLSDAALGGIGSAFLWTYAIVSPFAGQLADRFPRGRIISMSLLLWSLITVCIGFVTDMWQLLVLRGMLGVAESVYIPASVALIADLHGERRRATAMGLHLVGLNAGLIGGGVLAGYLGETFGWRWAFFVLGGFGVLLMIVTAAPLSGHSRFSVLAQQDSAATGGFRELAEVFRYRLYPVMMAEAMLISVGTWIFYSWLPLFYRETFGLSLAAAGFSGTFMQQSAAMTGVLAGGWLSDRVSHGSTSRRMLLQAVCFLLAAPFLATFAMRPDYRLLSICIFCYSLFQTMGSSNENPIVCAVLPARLRSRAVAMMNTANCLAAGSGVLLVGLLKSTLGLAGVFPAIAVLVVLAALFLLLGRHMLRMNQINLRVGHD